MRVSWEGELCIINVGLPSFDFVLPEGFTIDCLTFPAVLCCLGTAYEGSTPNGFEFYRLKALDK